MLRHTHFLSLTVLLATLTLTQAKSQSIDGPITLSTALELAIEHDPQLRTFVHKQESAEGQIDQAELRPTPHLSADVENILGTGEFSGLDGAEITLGISKVFESANKQAKRTQLAQARRDHISVQRELQLIELHRRVSSAFVKVLLAREHVVAEQNQLDLQQAFFKETQRLVSSSLAPEAEEQRAFLAIKQQEFETLKATLTLEQSKAELARFWGKFDLTDFQVEGSIELESELPNFDQLVDKLTNSPSLSQFVSIKRIREAELKLEEANNHGDIELFTGGRYANESRGDAAFVFGVDIPWPGAKQNQGNIRSAKAEILLVEVERETAYVELLNNLSAAYQQLRIAHAEALLIKSELLPQSQTTTVAIKAGYDNNQYTQLDVILSRTSEFEIQSAYLDALERYLESYTEIQTLTQVN